MPKAVKILLGVWTCTLLLNALGCTVPVSEHIVRMNVKTMPSGASISKRNATGAKLLLSNQYTQSITNEDIQKGRVEFPELVIRKPGYKEIFFRIAPFPLDKAFWGNTSSGAPGFVFHNYDYVKTFQLEKDPSYPGPSYNKNEIRLTVNSEPQGARIYKDGKHLGTTPLKLTYTIENHNYKSGTFNCHSLIAAHDTCLPQRQDLKLDIDPDWRYEGSQTYEYATLFLLKRYPNYKLPPIIVEREPQSHEQRAVIKEKKDNLDLQQQAGEIAIITKTLQPVH